VISELLSHERAILTSISVFELYAGIEGRKRIHQIETLIQNLIILPLDLSGAAIAGRVYTELKVKGQLIGIQDILIAGSVFPMAFPSIPRTSPIFLRSIVSRSSHLRIFGVIRILGLYLS